jgi:hypothetical protein
VLARLVVVAWFIGAIMAGAFGLLLIEDEPGASAARWYLVFGVGFVAMAVTALRLRGPNARVVLATAALALTVAVALHTFVLVAFAYHGLSAILFVVAVLATGATLVAVARGDLPRRRADR